MKINFTHGWIDSAANGGSRGRNADDGGGLKKTYTVFFCFTRNRMNACLSRVVQLAQTKKQVGFSGEGVGKTSENYSAENNEKEILGVPVVFVWSLLWIEHHQRINYRRIILKKACKSYMLTRTHRGETSNKHNGQYKQIVKQNLMSSATEITRGDW